MSSKRFKILGISLLATLALGSATALAAATKYKFDGYQRTQVTGKKDGSIVVKEVSTDDDYQGLYEITMWEEQDKPCKLRGKFRDLNSYYGKRDVFDICYTSANSGTKKTLSFTNTETYIRGVNVCMNKKGDRIKGLRIYGAKLNRDTGQVQNLNNPKEWKRPNCHEWRTARFCGPGKLATGIRIQQATGSRSIQGLALECRNVIERQREVHKPS